MSGARQRLQAQRAAAAPATCRLRVDQVVHGIALALVVLELLLGILALLAFLAAPHVY